MKVLIRQTFHLAQYDSNNPEILEYNGFSNVILVNSPGNSNIQDPAQIKNIPPNFNSCLQPVKPMLSGILKSFLS